MHRKFLSFVGEYITLVYLFVRGCLVHIIGAIRVFYDYIWVTHSSKFLLILVQFLLLLWFVIDVAYTPLPSPTSKPHWRTECSHIALSRYPVGKSNLFLMDDLLHIIAEPNRLISDYITCANRLTPDYTLAPASRPHAHHPCLELLRYVT
jgi:hypothetical protein